MSADIINLHSLLKPFEEMRAQDPCCTLRYWATESEYHNKAWREWFATNYPTVILHRKQDIQT